MAFGFEELKVCHKAADLSNDMDLIAKNFLSQNYIAYPFKRLYDDYEVPCK